MNIPDLEMLVEMAWVAISAFKDIGGGCCA